MKNKVIVEKDNQQLKFYLHTNNGIHYLCTQDYSKGVYEYFKNGRSENELKSFKDWKKNPRLNKTINRLPSQIKYVEKYVVPQVA